MKIEVTYDSKYSVSLRDGDDVVTNSSKNLGKLEANNFNDLNVSLNNDYVTNMKELNKIYPNFKYAGISKNTVIGILCRLIGEVRPLKKLEDEHIILSLAEKISFEDKILDFQNEIINFSNKGNDQPGGSMGLLAPDSNENFLISRNEISDIVFQVFLLEDVNSIFNYFDRISIDDVSVLEDKSNFDVSVNTFNERYKNSLKSMASLPNAYKEFNSGEVIRIINYLDNVTCVMAHKDDFVVYSEAVDKLIKKTDIDLSVSDLTKDEIRKIKLNYYNELRNLKEEFKKIKSFAFVENIWSLLFSRKVIFLLNKRADLENKIKPYLSKNGFVPGVASNSGKLTEKDFNASLNSTGKKKKTYSTPYKFNLSDKSLKSYKFGDGSIVRANLGVTKECGVLTINLDIDNVKAKEINSLIKGAGINTFHLGKKGLAYVSNIELE